MTPEEQQAQLDAMFGVSPKKKKKKEFDATEYENILSSGNEGDLMAFMSAVGEDSPSVINAALKSQKERSLSKLTDAKALTSVGSDLSTIDELLNNKSYEWLGGGSNDLLGKFGLSVAPGMDGFGDAQANLKKLEAGAFLQQIPQMKGLGALSDAEGQKLSAAMSSVMSVLPKEDGSYNPKMSEAKIKKDLETVRDIYTKMQERLTTGKRLDPETGEVMSQDQAAIRYPLESIPQSTDATAIGTIDLRNKNLDKAAVEAQLLEFSKNAKSGDSIILPNNKTYTKK
jgi:hypothetical protein